jgi:hypothetical protein
VEGINLGSKLANRPAVDVDTPGQDDLFTSAARSHAGIRQKFLKTSAG